MPASDSQAREWYFVHGPGQVGPLSLEEIRAYLAEGRLDEQTLVWRPGLEHWTPAGRTEIFQAARPGPDPAQPRPQPGPRFRRAPWPEPVRGRPVPALITTDPARQVESLNRQWRIMMICFVLGGAASLILALTTVFEGSSQGMSGLWLVGPGLFLAGAVFQLVLTYKFWAFIQDGQTQTGPAMAVVGLIIPLFNHYWIWVAVYGLALDLNQYCQEKGVAVRPADRSLALVTCLLLNGILIPYVGAFIGLPGAVLSLVVLHQFKRQALAILEHRRYNPPVQA